METNQYSMKDVKDKNESSAAAASLAHDDEDEGYDHIEEMPTIPIWSFEEEEVVFDHDNDNDNNTQGHHHYPLGGPAEDSLLAATTRTSSSSSWNDVLLSTTNSLLAVPSLLSKSPYSLERTTQKMFGEEDNNMNTSDEEDPVESTKKEDVGMMAEEDVQDIPVEVPLDVHSKNNTEKKGTKADETTNEEDEDRLLSVKNTRGLIYFGFYTVILLGLGMAIILLWNALSSSKDSSSSSNINTEENGNQNLQTTTKTTTAATTTDFFAVLPTVPSGDFTTTRIATTFPVDTTSTTTSSTTTTTTNAGLPSQAPSASPSACQDFIAMDAICYVASPPVTLLVDFANCQPMMDDWIGIYPVTANHQEDVLDDNYDKISWVFPACGYTQDACNDSSLPPPNAGQGISMDISHLALQTVYQVVLLRNTATGMGPFERIASSRSFVVVGQSNQDCGLVLGEVEEGRRLTR